MENGTNGRTVINAIRHAVVAGGLRRAARDDYPEAARGLLKAADFHSAKAATLADQIVAATAT